MRLQRVGCFGLSLYLLGGSSSGAEPQYRTAKTVIAQTSTPARPFSGVSLGRPMPVQLGKPERLTEAEAAACGLAPVSFVSPADVNAAPLIRAQSGDEIPQRLPAGTPIVLDSPGLITADDKGNPPKITMQKPDEGRLHATPTGPAPLVSPGPIIVSGDSCNGCCVVSEDCSFGHRSCFAGIKEWWHGGCDDGFCEENQCLPKCFWVSAEYVLWNVKQPNLPPLVTSSSPASRGVLGMPDTVVLYGGPSTNEEYQSGGRVNWGIWFDPSHCLGLEGSFLFIGQRNQDFTASSPGFPLLARPFFDVNTGMQSSELVADPNSLAGHVQVTASSRVWGGEMNLRSNLCCHPGWKLDVVYGLRFMELDDNLGVTEVLGVLPGARGLAGSGFVVSDSFTTRNLFYGGQVGLDTEWNCNRWFLGLSGKIALGGVQQIANISGSTTFVVPGSAPTYRAGGLLALPSNIGAYSRNEFSAIPEVAIKIGYYVAPRLRLFVGYNVICWGNVIRAAEQIDPVLNLTQRPSVFANGNLAGPARPAYTFRTSDFWAQGATFGIEFQY